MEKQTIVMNEKRETRRHFKHSKPRTNTKTWNVIPYLYRQAERKNKTREEEKVIYSRFGKNGEFTLSNNLGEACGAVLHKQVLMDVSSFLSHWGAGLWLFYARHLHCRVYIIAFWGTQELKDPSWCRSWKILRSYLAARPISKSILETGTGIKL